MKQRRVEAWLIGVVLVATNVLTVQSAQAAPPPVVNSAELVRRMDACMAYSVPESEILMGWVHLRSGQTRHWRCSSLRHMLLDVIDRIPPLAHDPYVDPQSFMVCAGRAVAGFPRPGRGVGNTRYIYQYEGTARRANVIVNDLTGDIASIFTEPNDDWVRCAAGR